MREAQVAFPPYDFYSTNDLLHAYREGPGRIRAALAGLSLEEMRARPKEGKWSILEIVLHTADSECIGAIRVRYARAQPGHLFPGYDQDIWTTRLRHNQATERTLEDTLQLLALLRRITGSIFEAATEADWTACNGEHPEYGVITLRNLLELYADHSERHLEQILDRRALLGRPLEIPPLLGRRLY